MKVKQILREYKERTPGFFDRRFPGHYAQIATVMTMKLKSAILNVARFTYGRGKIPYDIQGLSGKMEVAPQGISDAKFIFGYEDSGEQKPGSITFDPALQEYVRKYPDQWATVQLCLQLPMAHGKHAAAYLLSNRPLEEFIPNTDRDGMIVTQYEAKAIEALGGIKYDFLLVQTLNIIQRAIALVQGSSGLQIPDVFKTEIGNSPKCNLVPKDGTFYDVWRLPEEPAVFEDISEIRTDTVFQLDTPGVKKWMEYFREKRPDGTYIIDSIDKMAIFTALDRPGVLNMELENPEDGSTHNGLVEYVRRSLGKPDSPSVLPVFRELFPKTEGLVVLQEPLQKAYQYLTGCSGSEADDFRSYIGKKDKEKIMAMYPRFLERATEKLQSKELAQEVWDALNKSADYLFCQAHSLSYMYVAYACAYLKHYFPLEWWTAVMEGSTKEKIASKYWKYVNDFVQLPDIANPVTKFEIQNGKIRFPLEFLHGVGEGAQAQIVKYAPYADLTDFCQKIVKHKEIYSKTEQVNEIDKHGNPVTKIKKTVGHSAIHSGTAYTMIVAGAMDSFFPQEWTLVEKLGEFERVYAETQGKKKVEPVKAEYLNLTAYQEFVLKKGILPVWGKNLVDVMVDCGHPLISTTYGKPEFKVEGQMGKWGPMRPSWVPVMTLDAFKDAQESNLNIPKGGYKVALAGMVHETRNWTYGENKESEACEVNLEVEGEIHKFVMWPNRDTGRLDKRFNATLEGALAILVLNRYRSDKPFAIQDITIVEPAKVKKVKK